MDIHTETRIDFVVRKLREAMPKNWPEIALKSGVPESTIYKVAYKDTKDPRDSTTEALFQYFSEIDRAHFQSRRTTDKAATG